MGAQPGDSRGGRLRTGRRGCKYHIGEAATLSATPLKHPGRPADTAILIRALSSEDLPELVALHDSVSNRSFQARFFANAREVGRDYACSLFDRDATTVAAFVAVIGTHVVALGTAEPVNADTAELAILVADASQSYGLGQWLLQCLLSTARERGIHQFVADVRLDNAIGLNMLARAGFVLGDGVEWGVQHLTLTESEPNETGDDLKPDFRR